MPTGCSGNERSAGWLWSLFCVPVLLAAMLLTESRTGVFAFGACLVFMAVFSRARLYAWALCAFIAFVVAAKPSLFIDFWQRILIIYNPEAGGHFDPSAQTRIDLWKTYWQTASPQVWLLGQGRLVPTLLIGSHPHSTYLSVLLIHGVAGAIWFALFFGIIVRRGLHLVRQNIEPYRTIASAVLWGLLTWAIAGLTLDMLATQLPRYVYFFYAILIERSYVLGQAVSRNLTNAQMAQEGTALFLDPTQGPQRH